MSKEEDIREMANSFRSYERMYDDLIKYGKKSLFHPMEIDWMLEYFTDQEEYEKCLKLKDFKDN
jgi:hypothetical protein